MMNFVGNGEVCAFFYSNARAQNGGGEPSGPTFQYLAQPDRRVIICRHNDLRFRSVVEVPEHEAEFFLHEGAFFWAAATATVSPAFS